jgi:hypothetical protein
MATDFGLDDRRSIPCRDMVLLFSTEVLPSPYPIKYGGHLPGLKRLECGPVTHLYPMQGKEYVELYLNYSIRLHGVLLKQRGDFTHTIRISSARVPPIWNVS